MRTALTVTLAGCLIALGYVAGTVGFEAAVVLGALCVFIGIMLAIVNSLMEYSIRQALKDAQEDEQ